MVDEVTEAFESSGSESCWWQRFRLKLVIIDDTWWRLLLSNGAAEVVGW
jgi:hypothetical protein